MLKSLDLLVNFGFYDCQEQLSLLPILSQLLDGSTGQYLSGTQYSSNSHIYAHADNQENPKKKFSVFSNRSGELLNLTMYEF